MWDSFSDKKKKKKGFNVVRWHNPHDVNPELMGDERTGPERSSEFGTKIVTATVRG